MFGPPSSVAPPDRLSGPFGGIRDMGFVGQDGRNCSHTSRPTCSS
jgi:hypothetical protein